MKVICITTCQIDRKIIYKADNEYEISKDVYQKNKAFFKKVGKKEK